MICDGELTPGQLRKLEAIVQVKVVDRTWLILDIFAQICTQQRAGAGRAGPDGIHVAATARLGEALANRGPGIGTRGARRDEDRDRPPADPAQMTRLRSCAPWIACGRRRHRAGAPRNDPSVVIAGYTNAGKSSLLNRLTGAGLLVDDALFATLDPTVRQGRTPTGRRFTVTDTVGFVRHLPHELVRGVQVDPGRGQCR